MHEKHKVVKKYPKKTKMKRANEQKDGITICESPSPNEIVPVGDVGNLNAWLVPFVARWVLCLRDILACLSGPIIRIRQYGILL